MPVKSLDIDGVWQFWEQCRLAQTSTEWRTITACARLNPNQTSRRKYEPQKREKSGTGACIRWRRHPNFHLHKRQLSAAVWLSCFYFWFLRLFSVDPLRPPGHLHRHLFACTFFPLLFRFFSCSCFSYFFCVFPVFFIECVTCVRRFQ